MVNKIICCAAVAIALHVTQSHAQLGFPAINDGTAGYYPATGEIVISVNQVLNWVIQKNDGSNVFIVDQITLPLAVPGQLETKEAHVIGIGTFSPPGQTFADANLGPVLPTGLIASDFFVELAASFGSPLVRHSLVSLVGSPARRWNQPGPGIFGYEVPGNWTANSAPTALDNVYFPLAGDVDVVLGSASVARDMTFSDGVVEFLSVAGAQLTAGGQVTVDDPSANSLANGALAVLNGVNGAAWEAAHDLVVGNVGFGTFTVNNGGVFSAERILVGNQTGAKGNVTVAGGATTMTATLAADGTLYRVGYGGGIGALNVLSGATASMSGNVGEFTLGEGMGSTGDLNVDGAGSRVVIEDLSIGSGGAGKLNITGGGLVDQSVGANPDAYVALDDATAHHGTGMAIVSGGGSRWNFRSGEIGVTGVGTVSVAAGGRIAAGADVAIGAGAASQGTVNVMGSGTADSRFTVGGRLIVGGLGQGSLNATQGGDVVVGDDLLVGTVGSSMNVNAISLTNSGTSLTVADRIEIGSQGIGELTVSNGATASSSFMSVGEFLGGSGAITVNGPNSSVVTGDVIIGTRGAGAVTVTGGAQIEAGRFWVGFLGSSSGTVDVGGAGSAVVVRVSNPNRSDGLIIGGHPSTTGGTGTVAVFNGGKLTSPIGATIGGNPLSTGSLTVSDSSSVADFTDLDLFDDPTVIGRAGQGLLSILDGGRVESETATIGLLAGSPSAAGSVSVGDSKATATWNIASSLAVGGSQTQAGGTGLLNVNPQGLVVVANDLRVWGGGEVVVNGGTLQAGGEVRLNGPLRLRSGKLNVGSIPAGSEAAFLSHLDWQAGDLKITGQGLTISGGGPLGALVNILPGKTLTVSGGALTNQGQLNVIGAAASFTAAASTNQGGAAINASNATLVFSAGLTNHGNLSLANTMVIGSVANSPGSASSLVGSNSVTGNYAMAVGDALSINVMGANNFGSLTIGGQAAIDGVLNVALVGGFVPAFGASFPIVTAAGGLNGEFAVEHLPSLPGELAHYIHYGPTTAALVKTFKADFNVDGQVNVGDLSRWELGFGGATATYKRGDANEDGVADGSDFLAWQRQIGNAIPQTSSAESVPEPSAVALVLLALAALRRRDLNRLGVA